MTLKDNHSSESLLLEDAGLIRRNWRVGLRVIFGLFWAADAYLKWSLIAQGIDYRDLISSAAEGQPSTVASWIRFWADIANSTPGFPYVIAAVETLIAIHHHWTIHKTYFTGRNCLQLSHLEHG